MKSFLQKLGLCFSCLLLINPVIKAQEIACTVTLRTDQMRVNQQSNNGQQVFGELQRVMTEFVNGRRWTNDQFREEEKIRLDISLTFQKATAQGDYDAQAVIQVYRPIYNSSYESVLLRYVDRSFSFRYLPENPLNFNDNVFSDNLTSLLAYYSYIALAMDYDSFGKRGGEQWIQRAYNVANLASTGGFIGWDQRGDQRSRYWLVENLQNQQLIPFREGLYTYHRLALDTFGDQPDEARKNILGVLNNIRQVVQLKPSSLVINSFFDAKSNELIQVFSRGTAAEKNQVYQVLSQLDPTKADSYRQLVK
ncbi:hypothetical protein BWI96_13065 [Siphonobacter sp. SORGH_AS_0500]|uniref:type IX secretion system protein PorD n=1 Tax=Siphonobacter sp. SORGH_AS_0500 TaxID=1864824 RepID=UPI000CC3CB70|nr:DUF4835 family protein [Siphonobacter sp. SORGH_AS_0500]PKK36345.1 hypothetical protein BWI96_13065 [Siphonobacter sp. SORGH_AS_0500]